MRARIGVSDRMMKFDVFSGVMLGQTVLLHSGNLSRTLQKDIAKMTVKCLRTLRTNNNFALFWNKVTKKANQLNIEKEENCSV